MRQNIIILLCAISTSVFAIDNNPTTNARSASLGNAGASLISSINPGANSLTPENSASIHYLNPYGIKELSTVSGHLFFHNKVLDFGAVVSRFGYDKFNETRFSASVSKRLSSRLSLGIRLNYYSLLMSSFEERKNIITFDIGFLAVPTPKLTIGFIAEHILRTTYTTDRGEFELPMTLRFGANYQLTKEFLMVGEIAKATDDDVLVKIGGELLPIDDVALRVGLMTNPMRPTFGVGYSPSRLSFDVTSVYHTVLGFHTQFSMAYKF
ncbi:MAG: hypothetical protein ACOYOT_01865 [Bacteroidales bacterium]